MENTNVYVGLIRPKSPSNVGSVMRAAGCYQVDAVFYTGDRYERAIQFNTDTQNAQRSILLQRSDDLIACADEDMKIVCVELVEGAIPLPEFQHPEKAIYILGPEDSSINQKIINQADFVVYIPTIGCMNLAATANVVLYDRLAKSKNRIGDDDLIRNSRDQNNKTKVNK